MGDEMTVFFLGAGASSPANVPSSDEILSLALSLGRSHAEVAYVSRFLDRHFPGWRDGADAMPTFEEVLTFVDLALRRQEGLSREYDLEGLQATRENLLYALCWILEKQLAGPKSTLHSKFLSKVNDLGLLHRDRVAFLTTNYDLLLDNVLWDYPEGIEPPDYGIYFRNSETYPKAPKPGFGVRVLKLHGSLNWLQCLVCNTLKVTPSTKEVMEALKGSRVCENDRALERPIIVPPSHQKVLESYFLNRIWREAERVLQRANRVVFVGYSLSDADSHIRYLLKRGIHGPWREPSKRQHLLVVSRKSSASRSETLERYSRLFGKVEWRSIGFKAFVSRLEQFL